MPGNPVVILTQEEQDNAGLAELLATCGVDCHSYPCIATRLLPFEASRLPAGRSLADYRIVAFTSRRGVAGMAGASEVLMQLAPLIACVGKATAEEASRVLGLSAAIVPEIQTGEGLARSILAEFASPVPLLLVRGGMSSGSFQQTVRDAGWSVDEVVVYESGPARPEPLGRITDLIAVFGSPSAAEGFFGANPGLTVSCRCVAIGNTTAAKLEELGAKDITTAEQPSQQGLVEAVCRLAFKGNRT